MTGINKITLLLMGILLAASLSGCARHGSGMDWDSINYEKLTKPAGK